MADKKRYKLEDYGLTPEMVLDISKPYEPNRFESEQFLGMKPISPKIDAFEPIKQILAQNPNYKGLYQESPEFRTDGTVGYKDETKKEDLTFGQRGLNQVNDLLLGLKLHNSGIGEFTRQAGSPIASGVTRTIEGLTGGNPIDVPLGLASTVFGTLMTPFTAIRLGAESVGGETAGQIAEIGSLLLAGGTPLVAGYFASLGSHDLANKILDGTELDEKEKERWLEGTGLISFVLGHRVAGKTFKATNKKLQLKVEKYIDQILPENKSMKTMTINEIEATIGKTAKELKLKQERELRSKEPIEKKPYEEPAKIIGEKPQATELVKETPSEIILTPRQIKSRINELDSQIREAEKSGNERLFNKLEQERKSLQDKIEKPIEVKEEPKPEVKPIESLATETPKVESKTPQRDLLNANKEAIKSILDEDPSISRSPRSISKKLTSLVEQGKLPKKVSLETIKTLADEWVKNRPKPKEQKVELPETPLDEIKLPNFYGKNTSPTVGSILKENPEFRSLVEGMKNPNEINATLFKALQDKRSSAKVEKPDPETGRVIPEDVADKVLQEKYGEGNKLFTKEKYEAAKKLLLEKEKTASGNPFTDYERAKVLFDIAGYHIESGARTFAQFSKKMVDELGETVKPYLKDLWGDFGKKVKIDDTKIKDWIEKNKSQFNLTLEKIEGKIIDPNTGLEGGARNLSKREGSVIQFNDNTKGETWYHELSHTIYNKLRRVNPEALNKYRGDVETLIGKSDKPFSEQFADAFTKMYTDIKAPETNLFKVIQSEFDIPRSFDLKFHDYKKMGFQEAGERTKGERVEKSERFLTEKYDAPKEAVNEIFNARGKEEYKKLRDDGTQTFEQAMKEADKLNLTEESLLKLDPKTLDNKIFTKAEQVRIDQIALNKALKVAELRKTFDKQLSTSEAKTLNKELTELMQLQALAKNNLREAARVLESGKRQHRMSPQEYEMIQNVAKELDRVSDFKSAEKITDVTLKDKALYWWYNSILSNPLTDIANIVGNATNLAFEILRQPQTLFNGSALRGLVEGYKNAKRVWDGEQAAISKYTDRAMQLRDIIQTKSKAGTRVKNTLMPTSRLAIEDAFFRSIFESMRETSQAKATAKELGTSAKEIIDIYTNILEKGTSKNRLVTELGTKRFEKEVDAIENYANKMVFQKDLGKAGKSIQTALNQPVMLPVKMLALPFLRIAINLSKVSAEASPFGLLKPLLKNKEFKELTKLERQDIFSRAIAGTVFYTGLLSLLSNEVVEITGEAPNDKNIRELWYKSGYEPFSIIINKGGKRTVIPYQNVSPMNIILGSIGTMMTDAKYKKVDDTEDIMDKAIQGVLGFIKSIGNQSFLQGTSQLLNSIERTDEKTIKSALVRMTTPNLFSLFQGQADFGEGKNIYQVESLIDQYKTRLGITGDLKTKSDVFGDDLKSTYRRFPIPKEREINKISELLLRTGNVIGDPQNPKQKGEDLYTPDEYNEYKRYYRRNMYKLLNQQYDVFTQLEKEELGVQVIPKLMTNIKEIAKILAKQTIQEKK